MASLFISSKGEINSSLKRGQAIFLNFEKVMNIIILFSSLQVGSSLVVLVFPIQCHHNLGMGRYVHNTDPP